MVDRHTQIWSTCPSDLRRPHYRHRARFVLCDASARRHAEAGPRRPRRLPSTKSPMRASAHVRQSPISRREFTRANGRPRAGERKSARQANLFEKVASDFISRHVSKCRTARAITLRIKRELTARWAKRPITDISRADITRMVEEIADSGRVEAARQALTYCRRLFNWAIARDIYGLQHSPCDHINVVDLIGTEEATTTGIE